MVRPAVYLIEDFYPILSKLEATMTSTEWSVVTHTNPDDFFQSFDPQNPGCIVIDYLLPNMTAVEVMRSVRSMNCPIPFVVLTSYMEIPKVVEIMKLGALGVLEKPFDVAEVVKLVKIGVAQDLIGREQRSRALGLRNRIIQLSDREREVLYQVMDGRRSKEMRIR